MKKHSTRAFTLIEMTIVGIFLGLLALFVINSFSRKATASLQAKSVSHSIESLVTAHEAFTDACGHLLNFSSSAQSTANFSTQPSDFNTLARDNFLTLGGLRPLAPQFETCYKSVGLKPLTGLTSTAPPPAGTSFRALYDQGQLPPMSIAGQPIFPGYGNAPSGGSKPQFIQFTLELSNEVALHYLNLAKNAQAYTSVEDMRANLPDSITIDTSNLKPGYTIAATPTGPGTIGVYVVYR